MNLCFFMNVYEDVELASKRLRTIRIMYPEEDIICCSDGIVNSRIREICDELDISYFSGKRLKLSQYGGMWIYRMLTLFLINSLANYLIKIDPDSKFIRQFRYIPDADLFGSYRMSKNHFHINGGCLGISRIGCKQILESDYLNDSIYSTETFSYRRFQHPYLFEGERQSGESLIGSDLILTDIAAKLGLRIENWSEVFCFPTSDSLQINPDQFQYRYAVVHPSKTDA